MDTVTKTTMLNLEVLIKTEEWGSENQLRAENLFYTLAEENGVDVVALSEANLKATMNELVDITKAALGI